MNQNRSTFGTGPEFSCEYELAPTVVCQRHIKLHNTHLEGVVFRFSCLKLHLALLKSGPAGWQQQISDRTFESFCKSALPAMLLITASVKLLPFRRV